VRLLASSAYPNKFARFGSWIIGNPPKFPEDEDE